MKNKKIVTLLSCLLLMCCFICLGCSKDKTPPARGPIAVIEGMEIEKLNIFNVTENYYNIEIGITNKTEELKVFDFSKIILKLDGVILEHNGTTAKEYQPGQYFQWSFQIDVADSGLSVGDTVSVFYEDQLLKDVVVTEF